jgi:hypothetical protein
MRKLVTITLLLIWPFFLIAQDSIRHRILLIGDAGEIDDVQKEILQDAAGRALAGKSTAVFLGDNIYPRGMGLPGQPDQQRTEAILQSQYQPLRAAGAAVYFIPGNHDWDRMGPQGLSKIRRQWQFLQEQNDSLLALIPRDGCPDPTVVEIDNNFVIIAIDSEWWLFPFSTDNPAADCDCNSRSDFIQRLIQLNYQYLDKTILLVTHHPFKSYGTHGGRYNWKDHLFPLTEINPKLYIPLPLVGSLYPLLRQTFSNPEDLAHPLYKDLVREVDSAFASHPNFFHASGHEHGLQLIELNDGLYRQIVSGAGAKLNHTVKGRHSVFGKEWPGYVIADWYSDERLHVQFFAKKDQTITLAFEKWYHKTAVAETAGTIPLVLQGDSAIVQVRPVYNRVSGLKKAFLGANYRREFARPVKLPVFRLSTLEGGLEPLKRGGGMQTVSLRLEADNGTEWVLRNLQKNPDGLLPYALQKTFARDLLDDYMSAQHPFAPLLVPALAEAAQVPHAHPKIGIVAPDSSLGIFERWFAGKIALLEEREPAGNSDNTAKMLEELVEDNDNRYDATAFLRARMLDLLLGDWDRHADQWRWVDKRKGKGKMYLAVPRDRDQALFLREGLLSKLASRSWVLPTLQGFDAEIRHPKFALLKSGFLNAYLPSHLTHDSWTKEAWAFAQAVTDGVIDSAFRSLPPEIFLVRGNAQAETMKKRRDNIPSAMENYYRFISKRVDIRATEKNEWVQLKTVANDTLQMLVRKISKNGVLEDSLVYKTFAFPETKELRIYLEAGKDSVWIDNRTRIRIRLIGGEGAKHYQVPYAKRKVRLYDLRSSASIVGTGDRIKMRLSDDSSVVRFEPVNLYHVTMPLVTAGYNLDDGVIFGIGFRHTHQGFRKMPFASRHQVLAAHSFSTRAYRIRYQGEWTRVWKKADLLADLYAKAPDNTQNFFGFGNSSNYEKREDGIRYYRTRFSIYHADLQLRWTNRHGVQILTGPSLQWYRYDRDENGGRIIEDPANIGTYDSSTVDKQKWHLGWTVRLQVDKRDQSMLPTHGAWFDMDLQAYRGINSFARSYGTLRMNLAIYRPLNAKRTMILANRLGVGFQAGNAAFYQSLFLGGQGNLLGYRQFRFAGQRMLFNNLELRIKLADWGGYILPGQFGLTGFYDLGRVWIKKEQSETWHQGVGGGFYFAPAKLAVFQLVAGYSREGWLPYFTAGFRF